MTQGIGLRPHPWAPFSRPVGPDGLATRLRAILADLRTLEHELAWVERNNEDQPEDLKFSRLATRKAFTVARIANAIEQAIGPAPRGR